MLVTAACRASASRLVRLGMLFAVLVMAVNPAPADAAGTDDVLVTRDLPYGADQGEELRLDVYQPPGAASLSPMVILIHGGGWTTGDKDQYQPFARALATAGFVVFDINYTLDLSKSPAFPRQVRDVQTALAWVQDHAPEFHGDTGRIGVAGGSSGGHLAAMLGTQANTSSTTQVRAVVSLSGPMDLVDLVADLRLAGTAASGQCAPMSCDALQQATESLRNLLGCDPLQCPEQLLREASPITYVTSTSPPFFLANSTQETVPATQATGMADALRSRGVPVNLELVPGSRHSIDYVPSIRGSLLDFLATHVAKDAPPTPVSTVTNQPGDGQGHGWRLRWLVVATALCLLAVLVVAGRRASGRADVDRGDPLEHSSGSGDPVEHSSRSGDPR
jgi:acetyl esterase